MKVPFTFNDEPHSICTVRNLISNRYKDVPLMCAAQDLRTAAISAKVDVLRQRSNQQHDPLTLQPESTYECQAEEAIRWGVSQQTVADCEVIRADEFNGFRLEQP